MISPQKTELITFVTTNITALGSNVYPTFSDVEPNTDLFCVIEIHILQQEKMLSGTMYTGYARLMFVATDPYTLDVTLLDKFGDELELKYRQFTTMTIMGIKDVTEAEKYDPAVENMLQRIVDVGIKWYKAD